MRIWALPALALYLVMPGPVLGAEQIDSLGWAVRGAAVMPDYRGAEPAWGIGATLQYRHREWPAFALEADLTSTLADGALGRYDFSLSTLGGYLAWRRGNMWYLKLRGGVLFEYVEVGTSDAWGGGLSGGAGIGWSRDGRAFELELTGIEKAAYMISLAYYF